MKRAGETESSIIIQHEKRVNAHYQPVMSMFRYGQYIPDLPFAGYSSFEPDGGSMFAGIFLAAFDMKIDRLAVRIDSPASAGSKLRLGIYSCQDDLYPGGLILDAGEVEASEAGFKQLSIEQVLKRGYYFLAVLLEESCSLCFLKLCQSPLGMYSLYSAVFTGYVCNISWGNLPAVFPSGATTSNVMKMVTARVAKRV